MSRNKKIGIGAGILLLLLGASFFWFLFSRNVPQSQEEKKLDMEEILRQLPISKEAEAVTEEEKKEILRNISAPPSGLSEEEKLEILRKLSSPRQ